MRFPVKAFLALGVVLALAFSLSLGAGSTAEARNAPIFTERVDVRFQVKKDDGIITTMVVSATQQRGTNEVDIRYSVSWCPQPSLPELSACLSEIHWPGWLTGTLDLVGLSEAKLAARPNPPEPPCDTFSCPISRSRNIIALEWEGVGRAIREGDTVFRYAEVTGEVKGIKVPPGVLGTISVTRTRPQDN